VDVDDASLISSDRTGECYGLEALPRRIWELFPLTGTVSELCDRLLSEYDVDRDTCEREVLELLNDMAREGLIRTT
jgi:hypothetical protein